MKMFDPLSVGYDWEMWLNKEGGQLATMDDMRGIAVSARREVPTAPIGLDWNQVEFRSGPQTTFKGLLDTAERSLSAAQRAAREKKMELMAGGSHPFAVGVAGEHIHVGTVYDPEDAIRLQNAFFMYTPAFCALMANSPFGCGRLADFKSWRMMINAFWLSRPPSVAQPETYQLSWGFDATARQMDKPTIEVRVCDSAFGPRLASETASLVAAAMYGVAQKGALEPPDEVRYAEYAGNRVNAARWGLQATFLWEGEEVWVVDLLREIISLAKPGLKELGASEGDLTTIKAMLDKGQTQSDMQRVYASLDQDPWAYAKKAAHLTGREELFCDYLSQAKALKPVKREEAKDTVMRAVGKDTSFFVILARTGLPGVAAERLARTMENEGTLTRRREIDRGVLYTLAKGVPREKGRRD
jgi:gamma-glutamyl:cysteine ligase YbdK (ATP-grasp superfamily)